MYFTTHPKLDVWLLVFSTWLLYFLICIILTFSNSNDHRTIYFDKLASWRSANRKKVPHLLCCDWVYFAIRTADFCTANFFQQQSWWPWEKKKLLEVTLMIRFHIAESSCLLWQCSWTSSYSESLLLHRNCEHCVSTSAHFTPNLEVWL